MLDFEITLCSELDTLRAKINLRVLLIWVSAMARMYSDKEMTAGKFSCFFASQWSLWVVFENFSRRKTASSSSKIFLARYFTVYSSIRKPSISSGISSRECRDGVLFTGLLVSIPLEPFTAVSDLKMESIVGFNVRNSVGLEPLHRTLLQVISHAERWMPAAS